MGAGLNLFSSGTPPVPIDDYSTQLPGTQPAAPIVDQSTPASPVDQLALQQRLRLLGQMLAQMPRTPNPQQTPMPSGVGLAYPQAAPSMMSGAQPPLFTLNRLFPYR